MITLLKNLFSENKQASDGLNQAQREAIIDLLLLCMYADNHLALNEEQIITNETEKFDWESGTYLEGYIQSATAKVRDVKGHPDTRASFLNSINERLEAEEQKQAAFKLCKKLFKTDGNQSEEEDNFEFEIRKALNL